MGNAEKIADSELEVMRILWRSSEPVELSEIIGELTEKTDWKEPTIKTLVRNLRLKGAVSLASRGKYVATVGEREYTSYSVNSYVDRVFGGSAKKLVASLVSDAKLTESDVEELVAILRGEKDA